MPTVTKPKKASDPYTVPVKISKRDRDLIYECTGAVAGKKNSLATRVFMGGLQRLLTFHFNKIRRATDAPLPANIVAALSPIERRAKELADLLNPQGLPVAVLRELGISEVLDGGAWQMLMDIHVRASIAMDRLKQQKSAGMHVRRFEEQRKAALDQLGHHFTSYRKLVPDDDCAEYEGSKTEYLSICQKYLPKSPKARKVANSR